MKLINILFCLSILFSGTIMKAQENIPTQSVSIFKNGTAFIIRKGSVSPKEGRYIIEQEDIPQAMFGTFWFLSSDPQGVKVSRVIDTLDKSQPIANLQMMLQENTGKKVRVRIEEDWVEGTLTKANSGAFLLQTSDSWMALKPNQVEQIAFSEQPTFEQKIKEARHRMMIDFPSAPSRAELEMMYLRRDLGWIPNYLIELKGEDKAQLHFRAEMVNEAEDLQNAEVNFVVGVPNFSYAGKPTPLVSNEGIMSILNGMYQQRPDQVPLSLSNVVQTRQNISYSNESFGDADFTSLATPPPVEGSSEEDLYFYTLKNISLPKGGRAYFDILSAEVPVKHIYECQVDPNQLNRRFYQLSSQESKFFDVIHKLKIMNTSGQPFTTGPALVTRREEGRSKPISQDELSYTPNGGDSFLKITKAPDVLVSHKEEEIEVEENARRIRRTVYDRVTIEGEINIKNYKEKDVNLNVRRAITGVLQQSSKEWLKSVRVNLNRNLNPTTDVCWELELKPDEELSIQYRYQIYLAR